MFEIVVRELRATFLGKHARLGLCLRQLSYGLSDSLSDNTTDNSTTTEEPTRDRETRAGDKATDGSTHQPRGHSNTALHNWGCSWGLNPPVSRSARVM